MPRALSRSTETDVHATAAPTVPTWFTARHDKRGRVILVRCRTDDDMSIGKRAILAGIATRLYVCEGVETTLPRAYHPVMIQGFHAVAVQIEDGGWDEKATTHLQLEMRYRRMLAVGQHLNQMASFEGTLTDQKIQCPYVHRYDPPKVHTKLMKRGIRPTAQNGKQNGHQCHSSRL